MNPVLDPTTVEQIPLAERGLPISTYALLQQAAEAYRDRTAVVLPGARISYAELLLRVTGAANALTRLGVVRGDAVALLGPNNGQLLTALLGAQAAGIAQPINPALAPDAIAAMLLLSRARVLIAAGPEISPQLWSLAVHLGERVGLDAVLALRPDDAQGDPPALGHTRVRVAYLEDKANVPAGFLLAEPPAPDDLAAYFHTGGTTGTPKLAAHTHHGEVFTAWCGAASIDDHEATVFSGLPLFHVNGVVVSTLTPMFTGAQVVWAGPLGYRDPALMPSFWRMVELHRITTMSAVPTVYARLAQVPVDADISSLRFVVSGAAALPPAVRDAFERHTGVPICDGYGLTEATCASARIVPGHARPGSVGLRMPYQQIRAVDPADGRPLPAGRTGVLTISGPAVFPGYLTADGIDPLGTVTDGWLDTGDLGHVDADGYVYVTGRSKDTIIRGGHNIDPCLVEEALLSHPAVAAASAVGRPDGHAGEVPVCYVTLRPGAVVTEAELMAWAAARVPEPAAAPKAVYQIAELPLTPIGKIFRPALRADAIRRVVTGDLPGVTVTVEIENGTPVAEVSVAGADVDRIRAALGGYPFRWRVNAR